MKLLRLVVLLGALVFATAMSAEQRVVYASYRPMDVSDTSRGDDSLRPPLLVTHLLTRGWRIIHVATSGGGASWPYLVVFVLESPSSTPAGQPSFKRLWETAYQQALTRGAADSVARDFADKVITAAVATQEAKP